MESQKENMQTRIQFKRNERGQIIEALTTAVYGLVFISKVTYEYDEEGRLAAEITWRDNKHIQSIKRLLPELEPVA